MKSHLKLVTPNIKNRTVTPKRVKNAELRTREYLTDAEVARLQDAATLPLVGIAGRIYPMSVIGILGGWVALNVFVCAALLCGGITGRPSADGMHRF